ncbi:probable low molecular weight protein-tyrosine-phosphatase [gamma proteobacterium HdN1]|nr:probable low molecular weight protein-tyrosine-phosphatase [gamma proteobacterium HdN1]
MLINYLRDNFGSLKGSLRYFFYRLAWFAGKFSTDRPTIDRSIKRLVFICHGNICRSAFAEYFAKSQGIESISLGLSAGEGDPAFSRAITAAREFRIDLTPHRATRFDPSLLIPGDLVLAMEPAQLESIKDSSAKEIKFGLLGLYCEFPTPYLHDPYSCEQAYFHICFQRIVDAVHAIAERRKANVTPQTNLG